MMRYGSTKEVPAVVIVSNINTFIYRITAPQRYICAQSFQLLADFIAEQTFSCAILVAPLSFVSAAPNLINGCHCSRQCLSQNWYTSMWVHSTSTYVWSTPFLGPASPFYSETRTNAESVLPDCQVRLEGECCIHMHVQYLSMLPFQVQNSCYEVTY